MKVNFLLLFSVWIAYDIRLAWSFRFLLPPAFARLLKVDTPLRSSLAISPTATRLYDTRPRDSFPKPTDELSSSLPSLQELEVRSRERRAMGLRFGALFLTTSTLLGLVVGVLQAYAVLFVLATSLFLFLAATLWHSEPQALSPNFRNDSFVLEVRDSNIPDAGKGLFFMGINSSESNNSSNESNPTATEVLPKGTYLFEYVGERLTEDQYFERYPEGQGRYVAVIPVGALDQEPVYVDGADASVSGQARWMNSQPAPQANVIYRKQRFGPQAGRMFFYAARDISIGEELTFDYGRDYWEAATASEVTQAMKE